MHRFMDSRLRGNDGEVRGNELAPCRSFSPLHDLHHGRIRRYSAWWLLSGELPITA